MMIISRLVHNIAFLAILFCIFGNIYSDTIDDCFLKIPKRQLKDADISATLKNVTLDVCLSGCANSTSRCRSMNYFDSEHRCVLYKLTKDTPPATLKRQEGADYFEPKDDCSYTDLKQLSNPKQLDSKSKFKKKKNSWSDWSAWSDCDTGCGPGVQKRSRYCMLHDISIGAAGCGSDADMLAQEESKPCQAKACEFPARIQFEIPWLEWSPCSTPCGSGFRHRRGLGGKHEVEKCTVDVSCETINEGLVGSDRKRLQQGSWAPWSQWTVCECSAGESNGVRSRFRNCLQARIQCTGQSLVNENCLCGSSPVLTFQWQPWGPWSPCSVTCSVGEQTRTRSCPTAFACTASQSLMVRPSLDGFTEVDRRACDTNYPCNGQPQPPASGWSTWSAWSSCSSTCGPGGVMMRLRLCSQGEFSCGTGTNMEQRACPDTNQGQLLNWGQWHQWSSCTRTCGGGERVRRRKCPCYSYCGPGVDTEVATCGTNACQLFGNWGPWTPCSVSCGEGITTRNRPCLATTNCPVDAGLEKLSCSIQNCIGSLDSWSPWQPWTRCSVTCGNGQRQRSRICPTIAGCGFEPPSQVEACFDTPCIGAPPGPGWGQWTPWSLCSATCGNGQRSRTRACLQGQGQCQGGQFFENEQCIQQQCTVRPSDWSPWTQWSQCSVSCGGGQRTRTRTCPFACGGGPAQDSQACQLQPCGTTDQCQPWSQWTPCSVTCGPGTTQRVRNCPGGYTDSQQAETFQTNSCQLNVCLGPTPQPPILPTDCSPWTPWTPCSVSCGNGQRTRTRECPQVYGNTNQPNFPTFETGTCNLPSCITTGNYAQWSPWTTCSVTCGQGQQSRSRICLAGPNNCGSGLTSENQPCFLQQCLNIGQYTQWTPWTTCSSTCGPGQQSRSRTCSTGINNCGNQQSTTENQQCFIQPCQNIGQYTQWSPWTSCSSTCGPGQQSRSRICSTGVNNCGPGLTRQNQQCFIQPCQNIGTYGQWSPWTVCSTTCGPGQQTRSRICPNGQNNCGSGIANENRQCFIQQCLTIGTYGQWSPWSSCSVTCGLGQETRSRICNTGVNNCGSGLANENRQCFIQQCQPQLGQFGQWSPWTGCSASCGQGQQTRSRNCLAGTNNCGPGQVTENQSCFGPPCSGTYTQWSQWSTCSASCGQGQRTRNRFCNTGPNTCGAGLTIDVESCQLRQCTIVPTDCSPWNQWTQCSVTCGNGQRSRVRDCPDSYGQVSSEPTFDQQSCLPRTCEQPGLYTDWSPWTSCSVTCGFGQRSRTRICSRGQGNCGGLSRETDNCQLSTCAPTTYLQWSSWTQCSATCGQGQQSRTRSCPTGPNTCGPQSAFENQNCFIQSCQVIGTYGQWSQWTQCTATCGQGQQSRSRICSSGNRNCLGQGAETENKNCFLQQCISQWNPWQSWQQCSVTCGNGQRIRQRTCSNPAVGCGSGIAQESKNCYDQACIAGWTSWSEWNQCSVTCGQGLRQRTRICQDGSARCSGDKTVTDVCYQNPCVATISQWNSWSSWTTCSTTCGAGQRERSRTCPAGPPRCGQGLSVERDSCFIRQCEQPFGDWSQWTAWSQCTASCDNGQKSRTRFCLQGTSRCLAGPTTETENCFDRACPTQVQWSQWAQWNFCSVTCGQGTRQRNRLCPTGASIDCGIGSSIETDICIRQNCVAQARGWTQWSSWTQCTASCGGGNRERSRSCLDGTGRCPIGQSVDTAPCSNFACQLDVNWNAWSSWTDCSRTCDGGFRSRSRTCPLAGQCFGTGSGEERCNDISCIPQCDCQWAQWSQCSATCGGERIRTRSCQSGGGVSYQGQTDGECKLEVDKEACGRTTCTGQQAWSRWAEWSACSVSCGGGQRTRTHSCLGGSTCPGANTDIEPCFDRSCDTGVGIQWSQWGAWSFCSATCGTGIRERSRSCPIRGACGRGNDREQTDCVQATCGTTQPGYNWSQWTRWVCSVTCGRGTEIRTRKCPVGQCQGPDEDRRECDRESCTESGWGLWGPWSRCSSSCGSGSQQRTRPCITRYLSCIGSHLDVRECQNMPQCSGNFWLQWNDWSPCSLSCGGGTRTRTRDCSITGQCPGNFADTEICNGQVCGATGSWNQWQSWTQCTATCGTAGRKTRERRCAVFNGCDGYNVESQSEICNAISCTNKNKN